ncbi:MAG: cytidine deaminase [Saprospiraceae bacterium]|nr:cytidine deaminase [Saprospiraceae bacterium]
MKKEISISFIEISAPDELTAMQQTLLERANQALETAYAPYSHFQVGAAVLLENGEILTGSNMENASYPLCICAEHVAISRAHATYPDQAIKSMAITAKADKPFSENPVPPCGACRQIIIESEQRFQNDMEIILQGHSGKTWIFPSGKSLLPLSFDSKYLK